MNILYIGEGGEAGAKLVNLLSLKNTVTAVFAEKSVYEIECEVFIMTAIYTRSSAKRKLKR